MALVTLCPGCGTTFRVNAIQLQAHNGDLRCGRCQRIFNGFDTLITANELAIEYPSHSQPEIPAENHVSLAESRNLNTAMDQPVISDHNQLAIVTSVDSLDTAEPLKQSQGLWIAGNILLLLLLIGQLAYTYRTELTIIAPGTRPYLERYCATFTCTVPYPQDIEQLGIEISELQKNTLRHPEVSTLSAVIRNHASFPQALPTLQLFLLDAEDQLIASRIFTAQDYLQEEDRTLEFIASQHAIEIRLDFDSSELNASGYRLLLLYL